MNSDLDRLFYYLSSCDRTRMTQVLCPQPGSQTQEDRFPFPPYKLRSVPPLFQSVSGCDSTSILRASSPLLIKPEVPLIVHNETQVPWRLKFANDPLKISSIAPFSSLLDLHSCSSASSMKSELLFCTTEGHSNLGKWDISNL